MVYFQVELKAFSPWCGSFNKERLLTPQGAENNQQ